ncbi:UNVERIFIED_CONTAM: Ribokinase [Trichonephila clavipes]
MPNKSIVVVGGCIVDLISYIDRFPKPGETLAGLNFLKGCGGKAANQCVMAKKLGASTAMIAKTTLNEKFYFTDLLHRVMFFFKITRTLFLFRVKEKEKLFGERKLFKL